MKDKISPEKIILAFIAFGIIGALFVYVGMKVSIDALRRDEALKVDSLLALENKQTALVAKIQYLSRRERIVPIAESELHLIVDTGEKEKVIITSDEVNTIRIYSQKEK